LLIVDSNNITDEGAEAIAKILPGKIHLKILSLCIISFLTIAVNEIGTKGTKELAKAMEKNNEMEILILSRL